MFATTTPESIEATTRSISSSGPKTAAMAPLSATEIDAISRPRALTASSAASNVIAPAATRAPYSPRLWPITMSGRTPYSPSSRVSARSAVSMAGWVISVWQLLLQVTDGVGVGVVDEDVRRQRCGRAAAS